MTVIFTKLDQRNAFHLVRIREANERPRNIPAEHYESPVMPFGLGLGPEHLVNDVLGDLLNQFVFVYLDNILILTCFDTEHVEHMLWVLKHLLQNNLYVKAEKGEFHSSTVSFLGFNISAHSHSSSLDLS